MAQGRHGRPRIFEYVEQVAHHGSIRRAAESLGVASSAINRMLLDYEAAMGIQLFERRPRGVRLTAAGELLLGHIRRAALDFDRVMGEIDNLRGVRSGHITVATIEATAATVLAPALSHFRDQHRRVTFGVSVLGSLEVNEAVMSGRAELGLAINPPQSQRFQRLASTEYVLHAFVATGHPLANRRRLRLSDCLGFPVGIADESFGGRRLLDEVLAESGVRLSPVVTANSIEFLQAVVEQSDGICFQLMPVGATPRHGSLRAVPLFDRNLPSLELVLGTNGQRTLPIAAAAFASELGAALRRH